MAGGGAAVYFVRRLVRDVILVHIGSMSNLFAAAGWMLAQLTTHPQVLARVRAGEPGLLRAVRPRVHPPRTALDHAPGSAHPTHRDRRTSHVLGAGRRPGQGFCSRSRTPLPTPGLDTYDPDRWARRRLRDEAVLPARRAGHHLRPRRPHLPGPALLAGGDVHVRRAVLHHLQSGAHFADVAPLPVPDRRRRPVGRAVRGVVPASTGPHLARLTRPRAGLLRPDGERRRRAQAPCRSGHHPARRDDFQPAPTPHGRRHPTRGRPAS